MTALFTSPVASLSFAVVTTSALAARRIPPTRRLLLLCPMVTIVRTGTLLCSNGAEDGIIGIYKEQRRGKELWCGVREQVVAEAPMNISNTCQEVGLPVPDPSQSHGHFCTSSPQPITAAKCGGGNTPKLMILVNVCYMGSINAYFTKTTSIISPSSL